MRRTSYSIEPNGSLLLQPVTKDHQGAWECTATNRVALVKASTQVFVLGGCLLKACYLTLLLRELSTLNVLSRS